MNEELPEKYDGPPHDPAWETEPRWSPEDLARLAAKRKLQQAPGLASTKPEPDADEKTGS